MAQADARPARIGPNAIWQHLPVLDAAIGPALRVALQHRAGVVAPPEGAGMWPETEVAHFHRAVWLYLPDRAAGIQAAAGRGVADYLLAHRIPRPVQRLIRALPTPLGARLLATAIARNAWTFAGSGRFALRGFRPLIFEIAANPLAVGPAGRTCHWHAAVFARLFDALVWPGATAVETACCAEGAPACRFVILPPGRNV